MCPGELRIRVFTMLQGRRRNITGFGPLQVESASSPLDLKGRTTLPEVSRPCVPSHLLTPVKTSALYLPKLRVVCLEIEENTPPLKIVLSTLVPSPSFSQMGR